jgi:uncharacterized RDD family membrane protein YckC
MESNPYEAPRAPTEVSAPDASGRVRVGFWPRVAAAIIDGVVIWGMGVLISGFVASLFPDYLADAAARAQAKMDPKMAAQMSAAMIGFTHSIARWTAGATLFGLAYALLEGLFGRALGKLALGLRIGDASGHRATRGRLLARMALKSSGQIMMLLAMVTGLYSFAQIGQIPAWVILVGFLMVLGRNRQGLHDLAARTAVYHNSDLV